MTRYQRVQELKCWSNLYLRLKLLSQRGHWMIERPISWTSFKCLEILLRRSSRLHSWQRAIVPGGIKVHSCRLRSATMLLFLLFFLFTKSCWRWRRGFVAWTWLEWCHAQHANAHFGYVCFWILWCTRDRQRVSLWYHYGIVCSVSARSNVEWTLWRTPNTWTCNPES